MRHVRSTLEVGAKSLILCRKPEQRKENIGKQLVILIPNLLRESAPLSNEFRLR